MSLSDEVSYYLLKTFVPYPGVNPVYPRGTEIEYLHTTPSGYCNYRFPDGREWCLSNSNVLKVFHTE